MNEADETTAMCSGALLKSFFIKKEKFCYQEQVVSVDWQLIEL